MVATSLLPPRTADHRPELLVRASGPGRLRAVVLEAWAEAMAPPHRAGAVLSSHLRAARHLHSWERRFAAAGLYALVRSHVLLAALVGSDEPLPLWLAWLVRQGLPPDDAASVHPGAYANLDERAAELLSSLSPAEATALAAGVEPAMGAILHRALGDRVGDFLMASNVRAPLVLRANVLRLDAATLARRLGRLGIDASPHPLAPTAVEVTGRFDVRGSPLYRRGELEVQDTASQLVVDLVGASPGERVIDACAGAGGKTVGLGQALGGRGRLVALDVRERSLRELARRVRRGGVADLVERRVLPPGGAYPAALEGWADRVLVDAPCTGSGTLRRQPELRFRLTSAWLAEQVALQRIILDRTARLVRPGGVLVYATCSVLPEEDEHQVAAFLDRNPEFEQVPARGRVPDAVVSGEFMRTTPHEHGTDGFFGAVLRRR